jgi:hypothetical protein
VAVLQDDRQQDVVDRELVAEAGRDGDLVAALGAAAIQDGAAGFAGHANEEAVNFAATAAVGLECALRHCVVLFFARNEVPGGRASTDLVTELVTNLVFLYLLFRAAAL